MWKNYSLNMNQIKRFDENELKKIKLRNKSPNHINSNKSNIIIFKRLKTISKFFRLYNG